MYHFRFATKEAATHAIVATHNTEVNGQTVKCSWGKEAGDPNNQQPQQVGLSLKVGRATPMYHMYFLHTNTK